jgi:hypothetical protein
LKNKTLEECISAFEEILAYIETRYDEYPITRSRCDNGCGEYDSNEFKNLL